MVTSIQALKDIANVLRRDSLIMTSAAGSGHPTSCLSSAEIMATLYFKEMSFDVQDADNPDNDEFVLSKGHAAPIYYAALKHAGCITEELTELRSFSSNLEGHPMPSLGLPWVKVATGSLGQGLAVSIGMALASKLQKRTFRTYVLMGDSECAEGSIWEAAQLASHYKLNNLCAIVDVNKLGQRGETMIGHHLEIYKKRFESFGWLALQVDGHSIPALIAAFKKARAAKKPCVILAKTKKGKGVTFLEGKEGWHGKALSKEELTRALKELPEKPFPKITITKPQSKGVPQPRDVVPSSPLYNLNDMISTREAYGSALAKLAENDPYILALDAEVSNSTYAEKVKERAPKQFIETFIAEQTLIGITLGLETKEFTPYASTFAAFLTRAHDQLRMAALSKANMTIVGSHAGVSIGEDGASQMGLEDIALFRSLPGSIVLYPADAIATEKLVTLCSRTLGLKYMRTTRGKTPVIYQPADEFPLNEFRVLKRSNYDSAVIVGAGITLHESLKAHETLAKGGLATAVVDAYCIKPFPVEKFIDFVQRHGSRILVVEDHYPEGGIGEMIAHAVSNTNIQVQTLAVHEIPHSGTKDELMKHYYINADAIVQAMRAFV